MKSNFVIVFYERSGSTLLVDLLNQHQEVECQHEVFHLDWTIKTKSLKKRRIKTELQGKRYMKSFFSRQSDLAKGFKFKYPKQFWAYQEVYNSLLKNKNSCKIIFLYRINKLKGAISSQNNKLLVKKYRKSNFTEKIEVPALDLNIDNAIRMVEHREKKDLQFHDLFKNDFDLFSVSYESLTLEMERTTKQIFDFLGVDNTFIPKVNFQKITNNNLEKSISNYDVLSERLICTPFEKYLD